MKTFQQMVVSKSISPFEPKLTTIFYKRQSIAINAKRSKKSFILASHSKP